MVHALEPVRRRIVVLAILITLILLVPSLPLGPLVIASGGTVDTATSRGMRSCPGALPPPAGPDGIIHGNWTISCGAEQPVSLSFQTIRIQGNITIGAGSILNLTKHSQIIMVQDQTQSNVLTIQDFSSLNIGDGSIVDVTAVQSKPNSDIVINGAHLIVRSTAHIDSSIFSVRNSTVDVIAPSGKGNGPGSAAELVLDTELTELLNSTVHVQGGQGGDGTDGGASIALFESISSSINHLTLDVIAGKGGHGLEPLSGPGQKGGAGGDARTDIRTTNGGPITIDSSSISVIGGFGGGGGNGAMGGSVSGGNGGPGGVSGPAGLNTSAGSIKLLNTTIVVRSDAGGQGGKGGDAQTGNGGNGAAGGKGSDALAQFTTVGQFVVQSSSAMVYAGNGGNGGFMGNGPVIGRSGNGASGGSSTLKLQASSYKATNSSLLSTAGSGGWGGLGKVSGNGGDGGDALFEVNVTGSIVHDGTWSHVSDLGAVAGNGGNAGEVLDNANSSNIRGIGGNGGASTTILHALSNIDIVGTHLRGEKSTSGSGSQSGVGGKPEMTIISPRSNMTDSVVDWTMTGFIGQAICVLHNTTVLSSPIAVIDPKETMAKVLVYWTIDVNFPAIAYGETWSVYVFSGNLEDRNMIASSTLTGPYAHAVFEQLGVVIGSNGPAWRNYTVIAKQGYINHIQYSSPLLVVLNDNKRVTLKPSSDCCMNFVITSPEDGDVIHSSRLAPCRSPTSEEIQHGLGAPGCLKVQGDLIADDFNPFGTIDDIRIKLTNPSQGSFLFNKSSQPPVTIRTIGSPRMDWSFTWEVGKVDIANDTFAWMEGQWTIEVIAVVHVRDIPNNESRYEAYNVSIRITLNHDLSELPTPMKVDAGLSSTYTIPLRASGVNVTFRGASVNASGKVIRMEWDYNSDGVVDWSYVPTNCKPYQSCAAPTTTYVYSKEGVYDAAFCAIGSSGKSVCDSKKVQIMKEQEPVVAGIPRSVIVALAVSIISICTFIVAALLIASLSEATKYSIMAFILVPLYTRLKKEEMLDNYTRGEIRGYIVANPGAHYSRIKRDLNLNNGTLIYHLSTLEREGFIYSHRDDYYRRFYPRGRKPRPGPNLTTVQESIIEILLDNPGMTAEDLAPRLNKSRKVTNYHLVWLRRWGLIEAKDDGRKKTYTVIYEDETEKSQDGIKDQARPSKAPDKEDGDEPSGP